MIKFLIKVQSNRTQFSFENCRQTYKSGICYNFVQNCHPSVFKVSEEIDVQLPPVEFELTTDLQWFISLILIQLCKQTCLK